MWWLFGPKKNYAAVCICTKQTEDNKDYVRRVLISYDDIEDKGDTLVFKGSALVAKDSYFETEASSHTYKFYDRGYILADVSNNLKVFESGLVELKRPYHYHKTLPLKFQPIFYKKHTEKAAINKFNKRSELH
jgi:hypothetical protein